MDGHESIHERLPTKHLEVECGHALAQGSKTLTLRHGRVDTDESILSACQYGRLPCDNTSAQGPHVGNSTLYDHLPGLRGSLPKKHNKSIELSPMI